MLALTSCFYTCSQLKVTLNLAKTLHFCQIFVRTPPYWGGIIRIGVEESSKNCRIL